METQETCLDLTALAGDGGAIPGARVSDDGGGLVGSEILRIAAEIRTLMAAGRPVCNLTVGDFDPRYFPIPAQLARGHPRRPGARRDQLPAGERHAGAAAGRGAISTSASWACAIRSSRCSSPAAPGRSSTASSAPLCDPGDRVVYPVPSWNNNHYVHLVGARWACRWSAAPEHRFLPTRRGPAAGTCPGARLLCLNSPLNPTGTAFDARGAARDLRGGPGGERGPRQPRRAPALRALRPDLLDAPLRRHRPRDAAGAAAGDGALHRCSSTASARRSPPPACASAGASGRSDVIARMSAVLGHVGAWAPRAEQVATVALLDDAEGIRRLPGAASSGSSRRASTCCTHGLQAHEGARPAGGQHPADGRHLPHRPHPPLRPPHARGPELQTNDDVRRYVLDGRRHRHRAVPGLRLDRGRRLVPPRASAPSPWPRSKTPCPRLEQALRQLG